MRHGYDCIRKRDYGIYRNTIASRGEPTEWECGDGAITVTVSTDNTMLTVDETFFGLTAPASGAHIHCCAGPGVNAPAVVNFIGAGFLTGGISLSGFLAGLFSGTAYANIHDANFPGGEIRGQLEATATPEPGAWGLMGLAMAGLGVFRARLRRRT